MPSILPGYSYDIFISYRQKDNKYDGWVTEFIANLKKELEATFKYDVSIYFDANPHDGLLEMHRVDQSLEGKLKALILIPIISQTYCDPASFAWKSEFVVFNRMAQADEIGRDIRLENGNVISRILPVRIHDLDDGDKKLLASEIGGPLRSIDFIYRAAGVNRPLRSNEEHADENLNHTIYRDQINKVANSAKEILQRLINRDPAQEVKQTEMATAGPLIPSSTQKRQRRNFRVAPSPRLRRFGLAIGGAILISIAIGIFLKQPGGATFDQPVTVLRATIDLPDHPIEFIGESSLGIGRKALCISADGKQVAFVSRYRNTTKIFIRNIDEFQVREVPNSDGAYNPIFSRDGKQLLFFDKSYLRRVGTDGKGQVSLAELPDPWDITFGSGDEIFQSAYQGGQLHKIRNKPERISSDTSTGWPYRSIQQIPGTPLLLFSGQSLFTLVLGVRDLRTDKETWIRLPGASSVRYVPTGHLVYVKGSSLIAVTFDLASLTITSEPVELLSNVRVEQTGTAQFDFSANGTLVYAEGADARVGSFVLHNLSTGAVDSLATPLREYRQFSLSPDGTRIAATETHNGVDIFMYGVNSGKSQRLTNNGISYLPVWHPDSKRLFYLNGADAYIIEPDKNDKPRLFMKNVFVQSFSADGNVIVVRRGRNLYTRTMEDSTITLVSDEKNFGSISPNGKFVSYTSVETGESHVYLEPVPHTGQRWQVSTQGGSEESRWSRDGKRLYYRCGQKWYEVPVKLESEVEVGTARLILDRHYVNVPGFSYEVNASGSQLLLVKGVNKEGPRQIRIVHGWFEELKRLVP